ncbi:unnamed protein product [Calypogeia fissa]
MEEENGSSKKPEPPQSGERATTAFNGTVANGMSNGTSDGLMSDGVVLVEGVNAVHSGSEPVASPPPAMQSSEGEADYETNLESVKEDRLLKLLRANVEKLNPETMSVDDSTLRRFLRARQGNVDKATDMLMKHFEWRRTYVPLGYIPESEIPNELGAEKTFLQGRDKSGRPICVSQLAKHDATNRNLEELKKYYVYTLDKLVASMNPGEEKFNVIADLQGLQYKNLDPRGWATGFDFLQGQYPERMQKMFVLHVPYIFWGAWNILSQFIDKRTREKIVFVEDKNLEVVLSKDIDKDQLPKFCGGELDLVPIQDAPTPNWPPKKASVVDTQ